MYDLGIIGGMGPKASALLYEKIIEYTDAKTDQEHIKLVVLNDTSVPDRTDCILHHSDAPVAYLNQMLSEMELLKVKTVVMACNTAYYYYDKLVIPKGIQFFNLVEHAISVLSCKYPNRTIWILGTRGIVDGKVYDRFGMNQNGTIWRYPSDLVQEKLMEVIRRVKANEDYKESLHILTDCLQTMRQEDVNCVFLLACTELSLFFEDVRDAFLCEDALDLTVKELITICKQKD